MKAEVGDYIKTEYGPRRVVRTSEDGYELEDGQVLSDGDVGPDDVLLESEVAL